MPITDQGYVIVFVGKGHHLADVRGYAYQHRLEAERKIGRWLLPSEHVHHVNENKQDNRHENLQVLTPAHHGVEHRGPESRLRHPDEPNTETRCECGCGAEFTRFDDQGRPRRFIPGHNPPPSPTADAVLAAVSSGISTRASLLLALADGWSARSVAVCLSKLVRAERLVRVGRGRYALPEVTRG